MSTLLQDSDEDNKEKGVNKVLIGAMTFAVIAVVAVIVLLSLKPSATEVKQQVLEGAFREGSPEFAAYTKKIVAQTDENRTTKSPTAMGTMMMIIGGSLRNYTGKTLTGLELKVGVVDSFNNVLRERTLTVIPDQQERLETNQIMPVQVRIEGFDLNADLANIRWKVTAIKVE